MVGYGVSATSLKFFANHSYGGLFAFHRCLVSLVASE